MLNAIFAALAGSQTKMMGVIGGISLLINQFRHQLSVWVSGILGQTVRPEIIDVVLSLLTLAMLITVFVAFVLFVMKKIARAGKANRLAGRFAEAHMGAVSAMADAAESGELATSLRSVLSDLVHEVEVLQKKSKRLRARNSSLEEAYANYVHQLTVFSAATGGARISDDQPLEANLAGLTESAFSLLEALGYSQKSRKFRKHKKSMRVRSAEIDHALRSAIGSLQSEMPAKAPSSPSEISEEKEAPPNVIERTQKARAGKRMSRHERRKLSPWDQPGKVRAQRHDN
ncbi:MAG: hypothetical protein EP340_05840 [Alphaproteobacteria bacterium]|nr:MAG: hypothetical protein EP340_05840 [Alphaproteobacteria bacterium]